MSDDPSPAAHTRHGDLTLDQIGEMQPGMARLMLEISDRYWILYYAAKGGNWPLARHELGELRKAMSTAGVTRPKYKEPLEQYDESFMKPLAGAIRAQDFAALEDAYRRAVDAANERHREFGYEYIEWKLPETAPGHLRLTELR
ncbi:MAG: hypothetical protein Q8S13_06185 [Dehalococcoidia bacterium]|nr:hypothetical protein [Dehalococcoidia bacterium]